MRGARKMSNYYISFYLKAYRIHIFVDALRAIGSPKRICFLVDNDMKHLAVIPYSTRDFKSHGVPDDVYNGSTGLEISSFPLCQLLSTKYKWNANQSYRISGKVSNYSMGQKVVVFDLESAEIINEKRDES